MKNILFPNSSRSFDDSKHRVCFWGYDKTVEVSFYIGVEALQKIRNGVGSAEAELLSAFDAALDKIHEVAASVYANSSRGKGVYNYTLHPEDF
jgi:hypothetical protein